MGECLLFSKFSPGGIGNIYYIVKYPEGGGGIGRFTISKYSEGLCLLYSKHSGGRFAMRKVYYTTPEHCLRYIQSS